MGAACPPPEGERREEAVTRIRIRSAAGVTLSLIIYGMMVSENGNGGRTYLTPASGGERVYLERFQEILKELQKAVEEVYGQRLVTLAVFGSVGRNTPRPDSDIDLLIVADDLPPGRIRRVREFDLVEEKLRPLLERMRQEGIETSLSPLIKEPGDVLKGSLIFLDMLDDARILYDKNSFFRNYLTGLRKRLNELGAKKVYRGGAWYWLLKEKYEPGEEFEI